MEHDKDHRLAQTRCLPVLQANSSRTEQNLRFRFEEPLRFHRARYEHLTRCLQGKCHLAAALLSSLSLIMLGWKAEAGEPVSEERWLCGMLTGWFIVAMARLALFTCLAAPRFLSFTHGTLHISGLGILKNEQILCWSINQEVMIHSPEKPGVRIHICCRWHGWERHWTMLIEQGPAADQLQRLLEAQLPRPASLAARQMHRTIQIEDGILSH